MLYEYRVYEAVQGKMSDLHARFRDHTLKLFERHSIKSVGYWSPNVGEYRDRLIYIVGFEDAGHREKAWASFLADPDWQQAVAESHVNGPLVSRISNTLLTPTDYSPLQ